MINSEDIEVSENYKNKGNEAFKNGKWEEALIAYSKALNLSNGDSENLSIYYKNRAAVYLKLGKNEEALMDCNECLKLIPRDPKALYRRCLALECLGRFEEAYQDAVNIFKDDPKNKSIQPVLNKLHNVVQERERKFAQTSTKIESMLNLIDDSSVDKEKKETAMNNLLVLARDNSASELISKNSTLKKILNVIKEGSNLNVTVIRIIGELCKHSPERTKNILNLIKISWLVDILNSKIQEQVNSTQYCIQTILNSFSGMKNETDSKQDEKLVKNYEKEIDSIFICLLDNLSNRIVSGIARDAIIEILLKNIHYTAFDWAMKLVDQGGVEKLLDCTSELEDIKYESAMEVTPSTSTIATVGLARVYENMYYDQAKEKFINRVEEYVKQKLLDPDIESKIRVVVTITSLLRGPLDVGNSIIGKEGIMQMILVMANSEDVLQQRVACECIIAASSKPDKAKTIITQGVSILKKLYVSKEDAIRVRALVGLCKLGSSSGSDASIRPFADGSTLKLTDACIKFLLNPGKDMTIRKWAVEGLSYLTLDAEVKEKLIEHKASLQAMIELARTGDQSCLYGVIVTLVNLCNAYDKQEILPELVELAKFSKQHIPENHEFDDIDFVKKRIATLAREGVSSALVALSKTESDNSRELIARVFNALCSEQEHRGIVVSQGAVKVLISLSSKGTEKGKIQASQALARIAITINPEVSFPGQRCLEVVKPLISLLHPERNALENFEGLMALTNIAQVNETARQRILKEGGLSKIDHYLFEDHELLCRAATQCITNLTMSPDVIKIYEGDNDRLKMMMYLAMDEDSDTMLAASGSLAILTDTEIICNKFIKLEKWLECLQILLANPNCDIQYRGLIIVSNIVASSKINAEAVFNTNIMEILMALTKISDNELNKKNAEVAEKILIDAEKTGVIKKPSENVK